ncbi:hypothetical protein BD779DRAFT_1673638 [Infundibulicybe gibba]|nr:hypothetical protein BD779DRAFT_1673638 [Infundibulicybe gibba]
MYNPGHSSTVTALRYRASEWVRDLHSSFALHGCLHQHPAFPYSNVDTELSWFDERTSMRHSHAVDFRFRRPDDLSSPISWSIVSNIGSLGRVELDPRLFYDQDKPVQVDADLVLRCMLQSTIWERRSTSQAASSVTFLGLLVCLPTPM